MLQWMEEALLFCLENDKESRSNMDILGHLKTITAHKWMVMKYCFRVGLYRQGLMHDMSKYSPCEFFKGAKYYQGTRSPNSAEREETGLSTAWIHHKGRNKHHYEYWVDYGVGAERVLAGMPMPRKYIAEMVMDRISACRTYNPEMYTDKAPWDYYARSKERIWFIHDDTRAQLEYLLKMLAVKGEQETLSYIKHIYLKKKGRFAGPTDTYTKEPWTPKRIGTR